MWPPQWPPQTAAARNAPSYYNYWSSSRYQFFFLLYHKLVKVSGLS